MIKLQVTTEAVIHRSIHIQLVTEWLISSCFKTQRKKTWLLLIQVSVSASTPELANAVPCQYSVGLTIALMKKLQLVWNSAAEILTDTMHENHITLVVKNLLWLPVKYRIMCKVLVINLQVLKLTWV